MKVKDLAKDANITNVCVILPAPALEYFQNYAGGEKEMWIAGSIMGDFFLSPDSPQTKGKRRLYPWPWETGLELKSILDWEIKEQITI